MSASGIILQWQIINDCLDGFTIIEVFFFVSFLQSLHPVYYRFWILLSHLKWYLSLNLSSCSSLHSSQVILSYTHLEWNQRRFYQRYQHVMEPITGVTVMFSVNGSDLSKSKHYITNIKLMLLKTSCSTQLPMPSNSTCFWPGTSIANPKTRK